MDSGAIDHMTQSSHGFISYSSCPSNKKIAIAEDTFIILAGQGIRLSIRTLFYKIFYICRNYLPIYFQCTSLQKDLNHMVTFSSMLCQFQHQRMDMMIKLARKKECTLFT